MADRRLQVFHAVAKSLSFTRAAESLYMTQPAATFQVKQLEEQLNVRLFDRGNGRISLTPAGELAFGYAERILALSGELETRLAEMTGQMRGLLLLGACSTVAEFSLAPLLAEFNALHPQVQLRLSVASSESIENRVAEQALDLGLIEGTLRSTGLQAEICGTDEVVVACTPDYPLAACAEVELAALLDYEYLSREAGSGAREVVECALRAANVDMSRLKILMELGSPQALKGVVATGIGFALLSRGSIVRELQQGSLVAVPLKPRLRRSVSLVYPKDRFRSRLLNHFIEFLRKSMKGSPL